MMPEREKMQTSQPPPHNLPQHPVDSSQNNTENQAQDKGKSTSLSFQVCIPAEQVKSRVEDYLERCLVGLLLGPRPSMEAMRAWIRYSWTCIGIEVTLTQVLAKGYYVFMFKESRMAMKVISSRQWMFRHLPFCFMRWSRDFNPDGPKAHNVPSMGRIT